MRVNSVLAVIALAAAFGTAIIEIPQIEKIPISVSSLRDGSRETIILVVIDWPRDNGLTSGPVCMVGWLGGFPGTRGVSGHLQKTYADVCSYWPSRPNASTPKVALRDIGRRYRSTSTWTGFI